MKKIRLLDVQSTYIRYELYVKYFHIINQQKPFIPGAPNFRIPNFKFMYLETSLVVILTGLKQVAIERKKFKF